MTFGGDAETVLLVSFALIAKLTRFGYCSVTLALVPAGAEPTQNVILNLFPNDNKDLIIVLDSSLKLRVTVGRSSPNVILTPVGWKDPGVKI